MDIRIYICTTCTYVIPVPISTRKWVMPGLVKIGHFLRSYVAKNRVVRKRSLQLQSVFFRISQRGMIFIDKTNISKQIFSSFQCRPSCILQQSKWARSLLSKKCTTSPLESTLGLYVYCIYANHEITCSCVRMKYSFSISVLQLSF